VFGDLQPSTSVKSRIGARQFTHNRFDAARRRDAATFRGDVHRLLADSQLPADRLI